MATVPLLSDDELSPRAAAVFAAIREARGTDYVNNFWRALGHDEDALEETWAKLSVLMGPGALDPLVKEMIYVAVSTANGCSYCVHSHTAAAKAKGMSAEMHAELVRVIGAAMMTNGMVTAMQVPVDEVFDANGA
ncbi:carboxymuconolactone decarboxylase family protein [Vannielia litorea]|uniref:carboxymuconolactone decarboxylase family protein n=1 Tax=Vannielia litorea TaxID=1217970 RepID=UPI001C951648|nr:carboxymuconolactone decarboxylase family protein [Vannielia litorea]MBY6048222.1 carboxymuconolactone decarboxylase family protein [Vannielia litorea]MBY6075636.1 carboxymuconolactone decarboxylase family protein [Vannielia litorea]